MCIDHTKKTMKNNPVDEVVEAKAELVEVLGVHQHQPVLDDDEDEDDEEDLLCYAVLCCVAL